MTTEDPTPMLGRIVRSIQRAEPSLSAEGAENIARAALQALLEPTEKMLRKANGALSPDKRPKEWLSDKAKHRVRYQAMIRCVLGDKSEPDFSDYAETRRAFSAGWQWGLKLATDEEIAAARADAARDIARSE